MRRIDVHAHYFGGAVAELISTRGPATRPGSQPWQADTTLDLMDRHGIATQLLSLPFTMTGQGHDSGAAASA
jgi:aminocarboxymuconate-semialdehyde decarboxylase